MPPSTPTTRGPARRVVGAALAAILGIGALPAALPAASAEAADVDRAALVNPFVGTESEGNAYPGATMPFGMVQPSPDNTNSYASTSYSYDDRRVWGFSQRHVNSAGCPAAGELLVTPTTTEVPRTDREFLTIAGDEVAEAGYYAVALENAVTAELTATERTAVHRYTFPATESANVSFNLGQTLRDAGASSATWVDDRTLEGWIDNGGFCGGTDEQRYFFSLTLDRAPDERGTWGADAAYVAGSTASESAGGSNGAVAVFDTTQDQTVEVSIGVSFVDVDGARANRVAELEGGLDFDAVRGQANDAWNAMLGRIDITASDELQRIFATQLYKALLSPTIGSDVDGRYRGMDGAVHVADGWTYHQTFSLWDTYRTQATLHGIIAPEIARDIVRSMHQHRIEGGWLPRWSLGGVETNIMAGDPVSAWLAENFALGTVPDDIHDELWGYLIENATTAPPEGVASVGRQSAEFYIENGHIPYYPEDEPGLGQQFEEYRHGGSSTMEFAVSDAAIGAAAQRMGDDETAATFLERGQSWQRLWNPDVELSGGFQGMVNAVTPEGEFVTTPEIAPVQQTGFHEGVPWQYQWMANQDFAGLQEVMGGTDGFLDRLDAYFDMEALQAAPGERPESWDPGGSSYYTSIGYNPGNEPTIMNAWLYASAGEPAHVNDVLAANLNLFPNTPGGGVGNDDLGTLGAWYVMASIGIQPVVPGSGMLALNAPRVQQAVVTLGESGETVTIAAPGATEATPSYVAGVSVAGEERTETWIDVEQLRAGGEIAFSLTQDAASTTWGTARADWLPSVADPLRATADVAVLDAEVTEDVATTIEVAAVTLADASTSEGQAAAVATTVDDVELAATLELDGSQVPVTATRDGDRWLLASTVTLPDVGTVEGTLTVSSATETPRFAPDALEPVTVPITVTVLAAAASPAPSSPSTPPESGEPGASTPPAAGGGDGSLPVTGAAIAPWLVLAAALAILAGGLVATRRRRERLAADAD
ncbi:MULTISPECIES: GH92 family glycosyl hydrolase [unclassified Agrococcus]|uniref:GH92 family glycosyl hydrolase n=1 Tax=unclassified Agrococcus TaxID=2615065 RepID=UPI00360A5CE7